MAQSLVRSDPSEVQALREESRATGVRFLNPILSPHGTDPHKTLLGFGFSSFSFFGGFLKNGVVLVWQCIGGFHKGFVFSECLKIRVGRLRKRISLNFNNCVDVSNHLFYSQRYPHLVCCDVSFFSTFSSATLRFIFSFSRGSDS